MKKPKCTECGSFDVYSSIQGGCDAKGKVIPVYSWTCKKCFAYGETPCA